MVADFVRYYSRTTISHGSSELCFYTKPLVVINMMNLTGHGCRFCEILHLGRNISWLHIFWDICIFFFLSFCPFVLLYILLLSFCLFVFLSFCIFVFLSFCLFVFLSFCKVVRLLGCNLVKFYVVWL